MKIVASHDPDIAALTMPEAFAALRAYGPATRVENPRIRKVVREARSMPQTLGGIKAALQDARNYAAKAARRSS